MDKLKNEIERRAKILSGTHAGRSSEVYQVLMELLEFAEDGPKETQEYKNALNSEAVTFLEEQGIVPNLFADQIIRAVKHGAHWQKRRDEKSALEGQITSGGAGNYNVAAFKFDEDHTFTILLPADPKSRHGDKVKMRVWKSTE